MGCECDKTTVRVTRGNDFVLVIPVAKQVDGVRYDFPLPACSEISVALVSAYKRTRLECSVSASKDNVVLAKVEGDRLSCGVYALEVKGKIFGADWRSNEYAQLAIVDNNAAATTEFGQTEEGENSVEMDTQVVVMGAVSPAINPRGAWSADAQYVRGDAVAHGLSSWWAAADNTASEPKEGNTDWVVLLDASDMNGAVEEAKEAAELAAKAATEAKEVIADVETLTVTVRQNAANITALQDDTDALKTDVQTVGDDVTALAGRVTTAEGDISGLKATVATKADKSDTYTKTEVDDKLANIDLSAYYTKTESDTKYATNDALSDVSDAVGDLQNTKADKTDLDTLSTKVDTNTTNIATKANSSDVYTKTQSDGKYATQTTVNTLQSAVDTKASQSDLTALKADVATNTTNIANKASISDLNALKTSVEDNTTSITNLTATVGTKADASDLDNYYTKTEVDAITGDIKSALVTINGEDA